MQDNLGKGNWQIKAPDILVSHETKTENGSTYVKLNYADGTIIESLINLKDGSVKMNINRDYIVNPDGTIDIVK